MFQFYVLVLLFIKFPLLNASLNIPKLLENDTNIVSSVRLMRLSISFEGGGGTKARISRKGINYVATVLTQNLIPEIVNARMNEEPSTMEVLPGCRLARIQPNFRWEQRPLKLVNFRWRLLNIELLLRRTSLRLT